MAPLQCQRRCLARSLITLGLPDSSALEAYLVGLGRARPSLVGPLGLPFYLIHTLYGSVPPLRAKV